MLASLTGLLQLIRCPAGCSAAVLQWMLQRSWWHNPKLGTTAQRQWVISCSLQCAHHDTRLHQAGGRRELGSTPRTQWLLLLHAYEEMRPEQLRGLARC